MRAVTVTEFAKERGVSRARVYQWIEDGRVERLEDGRIDAEAAHAKLGATLDQAKGIRRDGNVTSQGPALLPAAASSERPTVQTSAPPASSSDLLGGQEGGRGEGERGAPGGEPRGEGGREDYWESKARREAAEAQLSEMRALKEAGALVPAAGVRKELAELARATRNAMLAIPDQASAVLNPADPAKCHKLLTDLISRALRDLTARLEARIEARPEAQREAERPEGPYATARLERGSAPDSGAAGSAGAV